MEQSINNTAVMREAGKEFLFHHNDNETRKIAGLKMLLSAQEHGDPEAEYIVARLILDGFIRRGKNEPEEDALTLMCKSANGGWIQARAFLNSYCEQRYEKMMDDDDPEEIGAPLKDFDGRKIRISRKGILSPIDAVLEYRDGENILNLNVNVRFYYSDNMAESEKFEAAVLAGIYMWQGEYEVFDGQKVTVKLNITTEPRLFDNLIVMPVTQTIKETFTEALNRTGNLKNKEKLEDFMRNKRSFASTGRKWSVNSRKMIFIQSQDGNFNDYEEIGHVAKHEFGHALGLGDLYASRVDSLDGVKTGTYSELDSYAVTDRFYNLVMCDHHGPISRNDIEMVLLAFRENRAQLYQPGKLNEKISSALGRGN